MRFKCKQLFRSTLDCFLLNSCKFSGMVLSILNLSRVASTAIKLSLVLRAWDAFELQGRNNNRFLLLFGLLRFKNIVRAIVRVVHILELQIRICLLLKAGVFTRVNKIILELDWVLLLLKINLAVIFIYRQEDLYIYFFSWRHVVAYSL